MRKTKKLTLSAIMTALGVVFLSLGSAVELLDFVTCIFASVIMLFIYIEVGSPFTWLTWLTTALLCYLFFPASFVWLNYLLAFGLYPIVKAYIEKLPKMLWLLMKLVYVNAVIWALIFLYDLIFGVPLLGLDKLWLKIVAYVVINIGFLAYDIFLTLAVRLYLVKYRHRFARFLK